MSFEKTPNEGLQGSFQGIFYLERTHWAPFQENSQLHYWRFIVYMICLIRKEHMYVLKVWEE